MILVKSVFLLVSDLVGARGAKQGVRGWEGCGVCVTEHYGFQGNQPMKSFVEVKTKTKKASNIIAARSNIRFCNRYNRTSSGSFPKSILDFNAYGNRPRLLVVQKVGLLSIPTSSL